MSLINEALNKVQQQRKAMVTTNPSSTSRAVVRYPSDRDELFRNRPVAKRTSPYIWVFVNVAVVVVALIGYRFFFRDASSSASSPSPVMAAPVASSVEINATDIPTASSMDVPAPVAPAPEIASPFSPARVTNEEYAPVDSDYDLAGMTEVGKITLLSITRRSDQRSFWVPVGKTVGEVTAVSYNPESDNARIRVRGRLVTIMMRNGSAQ